MGPEGLTEEQRILLNSIRKAVEEKIAPRAAQTDLEGRFDWEMVDLLWNMGLMTIALPEEYGGWSEQTGYTLCLAVEELAKACPSTANHPLIQAVAGFVLNHGGSPELKAKYLPWISEKRLLMGYLVTEPGAGSDVASIITRAEKDGDRYIINGRKMFATNGGVAGLYSVLARTGPNELSFFIVERDWPGVSIGKDEDKCGFRGSNTAEVILEDVEVPASNLVGQEGNGFPIAMADFDMSRPAIAAMALGIAEGALAYALRYAKERTTFGRLLVDHQAISFMLVEAATKIEAGRGLVERAARAYDQGRKNTELAAMAKCFCSDAAMAVTTDMIQIMGGYGYMKDHPLERMFRDAKLTQIFEGANQIQRIIIAREMLKKTG